MTTDVESDQEKKLPDRISEDVDHVLPSSDSDQAVVEKETSDDVVDWNGPDDVDNPRNWPTWKRMIQVVIASAFLLTA